MVQHCRTNCMQNSGQGDEKEENPYGTVLMDARNTDTMEEGVDKVWNEHI